MASSAATDKEEIASTHKEAQADAPAEIVAVDLPAPTGWTKKVSFSLKLLFLNSSTYQFH